VEHRGIIGTAAAAVGTVHSHAPVLDRVLVGLLHGQQILQVLELSLLVRFTLCIRRV
jgi:hypothetical protein